MALDPRIALAARGNQGFEKFQTGQINAGNLLAQSQATQQSAEAFPLLQTQREQANTQGQQGIDLANVAKAQQVSQAALQFARTLQRVPSNQRPAFINTAIQDGSIAAAGLPPEKLRNIDITDEGVKSAILQGEAVAQQLQQQLTAGQREFQSLVATANLSPKDQVTAARRALFLDAKPVGSSALTIADEGKSQDVATSQANIAGQVSSAAEEAKLREQAKLRPQIEKDIAEGKVVGAAVGGAKTANIIAKTRSNIEKAVTLARKDAEARGETLTDLKRAKAALPGIRNVIGQLKDLALIATSTLGGRVFDTAVKELGFGSTKGATARAKFISLINNQVLPLLKPTFGGSFSLEEGNKLEATLADPDSSPDQKIATLDAFLDQKVRDIETDERELGIEPTPRVLTDDISDEDLLTF